LEELEENISDAIQLVLDIQEDRFDNIINFQRN
jgi:predicted RNase H-like HicB family nuclease